MPRLELHCTSLTPDRIVAHFRAEGLAAPVFAYLPHVSGLNPFLLRIGDRVAGLVEERGGRPELLAAYEPPRPLPESVISTSSRG